MPKQSRFAWIIFILLFIVSLLFSLNRDIQLVKGESFGDLRNRIVGARQMNDGNSPYWHKWEKKDGTRLYDKWNILPLKITNITASPFYLHLLQPFAEQPQSRLRWYWLFAEYFMYLFIVWQSLKFTNPKTNSDILLLLPVFIFTFTTPWIHHIFLGQSYILIPLLLLVFVYVFTQAKDKYLLRGFGICQLNRNYRVQHFTSIFACTAPAGKN